MSNISKYDEAIAEAERFISRAKKAQEVIADNSMAIYGCKETAAAKRASMDLTRSLAEFRK